MVNISKNDIERIIVLLSDAYGKSPEEGFCHEIASSEDEEKILILKSYAYNIPVLRHKNKTKPLGAPTFVVKNLNLELGEKLELTKSIKNKFSLSLKEATDVVTHLRSDKGILIKNEEKLSELTKLLDKTESDYEIVSGEGQKTRISL